MTRIEIDIAELVLRDVPGAYAADLGPLIQTRLQELAAAQVDALGVASLAPASRERVGPLRSEGPVAGLPAMADTVARQVWSAVTGDGGGAR